MDETAMVTVVEDVAAAAAAAGGAVVVPPSPPAPPRAGPAPTAALPPSPLAPAGGAAGRRAKFTANMDLHLLRAVASARAHLAGYGGKKDAFDRVAADCKAAACFAPLGVDMTGKSARDRYRKLLAEFRSDDRARAALSGTDDEEVSEMRSLLADVAEGEDDVKAKRASEREKKRGLEDRLLTAGANLRDMSMARTKRRKSAGDGGGAEAGGGSTEDDEAATPPGAPRRTASTVGTMDDDMEMLREHNERESKRADVERENLGVSKGALEATREFGERAAKHSEEMAAIERERVAMEKSRLRVESDRLRIETERVRGEAASRREELAQACKRADAEAKRAEGSIRIREQELALAQRRADDESRLREADQKERSEVMRAMLDQLARRS